MPSDRRQIGIKLFNNHETDRVFNSLKGEQWRLNEEYEDAVAERLGPFYCDLSDFFSSRVCLACEAEEAAMVSAIKSAGNNYDNP